MQDHLGKLDYPLMHRPPAETQFLVSCFHTPAEAVRRIFYTIVRAGHVQAAANYRVEREHLPGHDLLLCLRGSGFVLSQNRRFRVGRGELAWISGYHPHAHWADPTNPWELSWLRLDGRALEETCNILSVLRAPVFTSLPTNDLLALFKRVQQLMTERPTALDALLNAVVAQILGILFENRQTETARHLETFQAPAPDIQNALTQIILYPDRAWKVRELAKLSGLSQPHFFRRFRQATGSSPIDLLRRERINHARRRLLQSKDSIKEIAEQVGYQDAFFFSRDFKRYTGVPPSTYRQRA
jgi:AraC family transcriptional regulator, arabinose operon regulatory protein